MSLKAFDDGFKSGFLRGEAFALQQAVGMLRRPDKPEWKEAADLLDKFWEEKMRSVDEHDRLQYGTAGKS